MNIIKKIIRYLKNIFSRQKEIKMLEGPKEIENNKKSKFIENIKIDVIEKKKRGKVETLICEGDGLGIQKKLKF